MATFDDLPSEIHELIYLHLFAGRKVNCYPRSPYHIRSDKPSSIIRSKYSKPLPILLVNRRCHSEALAVLFNHTTIDLTQPISNSCFLQPRCYRITLTSRLAHVEIHLCSLVTSRFRGVATRLQASLGRLPNIRTITLLLRSENHHTYHIGTQPDRDTLHLIPPPLPPFPELALDGLLAHATRQIQREPYQMLDRGGPHQLVRHVLHHWKRSRTTTTRRSQGPAAEQRGYDLRTRLQLRYLPPTSYPQVFDKSNRQATMRVDGERPSPRAAHATYSFAKEELVVEGAAGVEEDPVRTPMRVEVNANVDGEQGIGVCGREKPCNSYCQTLGFPPGYFHLVSLR